VSATFLYLEDDPLSQEVMSMILERIGYRQLTIFNSSEHFLNRLEALGFVPDVFFLDIYIRPMTGLEVIRALRTHPAFGTKKVIALTASVMNDDVAQLKRAGFDGMIGKPLDFDLFPTLLSRVLAGEAVWHIS
jgi:two-component system cell cycle response regulator DivK